MSLVRWFRKNNKKAMAVVVIVIMVGFIGGTYIQQLGERATGLHKVVAWFGDNNKITNYDLSLARQELEILRALRMDALLSTHDLRTILLGELLFSERRTSPALINRVRQIIRANNYRISDKQINDIYRRSMSSEVYWLLLKREAELAGITVSDKTSGHQLGRILIPQLFNGATYSQVISFLINQHGVPEDQILTAFSKLLAVLEYAAMVCSSEDMTDRQIIYNVSMEQETVDVEFVKFDSAVFAETQGQPGEQEISEHFDSYKRIFAGDISDGNPYGFGYKLPDRARIEYIAVKLDDVSAIVTPPTQEEIEEHYQKNRQLYIEQVPSDPNDPNSATVERTKSYAEVAGIISDGLLRDKINLQAERILLEAKTVTEAGLEATDTESANVSSERFKQMTGDYVTTAEELTEKYKVKVYAGRTGMLGVVDMQVDEYLGMLHIEGYGGSLVGLYRIIFAIDELGASELGPFDAPKPMMYENIGLVKDIFGRIVAIVRVIEAQKASEPGSINQTFSRETIRLEQDEEQPSEDIYSVKEKVIEDLRELAVMKATKGKAEEFIEVAVKDGWDEAVERFNELYGQSAAQEEGDPNVFSQQSFTDLRRTSRVTMETLAAQNEGNPAAQFLINAHKKEAQLIEQLYSLVPQDSNTVESVPLIVEFKPDMSYYCLKKIHVNHIEQDEYEKIKAMRAYREDDIQSQSLAVIYLNPENILQRTNFRWAGQEDEAADANAPM